MHSKRGREPPHPHPGLRACDRVLDPEAEPPIGAQLLTPRRGYTHHGIYVGCGHVVHFRGFSRGVCRGPVEEVSLRQFARGRPVWIRLEESSFASQDEVVRRARQRLGEKGYRLLTNNCEHFCEWCIRGRARSYQVDVFLNRWCGTWRRLEELLFVNFSRDDVLSENENKFA